MCLYNTSSNKTVLSTKYLDDRHGQIFMFITGVLSMYTGILDISQFHLFM